MGGRIHGFLGGALLTSAFVYYTGEYIKKDQQFVSRQLRVSNTIVNEGIIEGKQLVKPVIPAEPRGTKQIHAGVWESAKDIWNEEVIYVVNRLYSINWYEFITGTGDQVNHLTDKAAEKLANNIKD